MPAGPGVIMDSGAASHSNACDLIVRLLAPKREPVGPGKGASGSSKAGVRIDKQGKRGRANQRPERLSLKVLRREARNEALALIAQLRRKLPGLAGTPRPAPI